MKLFFRTASFIFLLTALSMPKAFAQRHALFETFTNSNEPCADPARAPYETAANSTASQEASKIVRLNYHVANLQDQLAVLDNGGGQVDYRLTGVSPGAVIYTSAVDRATFPQDGQRVDPPTSGSGSYSDWAAQIDNDVSAGPEASVTLNFATIDKSSSQYYKLHADMTVKANQDIPDSLIIRYAITQDNVHWTECGKVASVQNDVVWQVTTQNTGNFVVFPSGASSGATQHVTCDLFVDLGYPLLENPANMKFVAFLEDDGGGDYFVANAAILKKDLDTLRAPAPTLTLTESSITDSTLYPGKVKVISFSSSNLPQGTDAYYSLDNGLTWRLFDTSLTGNSINWSVPDSLTTQGKIKLIAHGDSSLTSTEIGTFTIANPASITFDYPPPGIVLKGGSADTIRWTNYEITGNVKLKYSLRDNLSTYSTFTTLQDSSATSFTWTAPDTNDPVEFELVPDNPNEAQATVVVIDTIMTLLQGVTANSITSNGLAITDVFPNPASNGEEMVVEYSEAVQKPLTMQVLDLLGRASPVFYSVDNQAIRLNTNSLMAGAYVLRVTDGTNVVSKRVEVVR